MSVFARPSSGVFSGLCVAVLLFAVALPARVIASTVKASPESGQEAKEAIDFWTPQRMKRAEPLSLQSDLAPKESRSTPRATTDRTPPRYVPGALPGTSPAFKVRRGESSSGSREPRNHPFPFTVTEIAQTAEFPYRLNGQAFFETPDGLFSCSGTVVVARSKRFVLTAAHCLLDAGVWSSNWIFVPGYRDGQAPFGAWAAKSLYVTKNWARTGNENFDFGAAVMRKSGGRKIQKVVGGEGIEWGQPPNQLYDAYGYPFGGPYDGESLWLCQSQYAGRDPHYIPAGPSPIAIGCDFPVGASGGDWIVNDDFLNSVTSFGYDDHPGILYGPYFGRTFGRFYKAVHKLKR